MACVPLCCRVLNADGLRQGNGLCHGHNIQQRDSNAAPVTQLQTSSYSDPSSVKSLRAQKSGIFGASENMTTPSAFSGEEAAVGDNDAETRLGFVASNCSPHGDTAIQIYEDSSEQLLNAKASPSMPSPIGLPIPIPPPFHIPPPPSWVKSNHTNSQSLGLSSAKKIVPKEVLQESTMPFESHAAPSVLELQSVPHHTIANPTSDLEYERIERFRLDCWTMRERVHELRGKLREKQRIKSMADDKLLQRISLEGFGLSSPRGHAAGDGNPIAELMKDCRDVRGEYGPLEDDCNALEDQLSEQEFELSRMEKKFYDRWRKPPSVEQPVPAMAILHERSPTPSTFLDIEEIPQEHPLVTEFESRMGDLEILQERLVDIEEEREALEDQKDFRQRFSMTLEPEDEAWLNSSQGLLVKLHEETRVTEEDVNRLKEKCLSLGLIDEFGEPTDFRSQARSTFQNDEDMNPEDQISEYVKHPILLPKHGIKPAISNDSAPESDQKPECLGGRINHWILGRLRESPLEVSLLERTFESDYGEIDDHWDLAVLALWWDDETTNTLGHRIYTSNLTTEAQLSPDHSSTSSRFDPQLHIDGSYRAFFAHQLRYPPSPDHSEGTEKEKLLGTLSSLPKVNLPLRRE